MTAAVDPTAIARSVLSERRFHNPPIPRPLHGVIDWIDQRVDSAVAAVRNPLDALGTVSPWLIVGALIAVALVAALLSRHVLRRRVLERPARAGTPQTGGPSARALLRAADAAEREGRGAQALRLRYRAGLLELSQRGVIEARPSMLGAQLRARLRSPLFDELTGAFERVVYGGAVPDDATVRRAREAWRELLSQVAR